MAQLTVDQIWCDEETDEVGSDSVYFVVFRGNTTGDFNSNVGVHGPGLHWDDFDTGEATGHDKAIAQYFPESVYVVTLIEKDHGRDIAGPAVIGAWKAQTGITWKSIMVSLTLSSPGPLSAQQKAGAAQGIRSAMLGLSSIYNEFPFGDDDMISQPKQIVIAPGQKPTLTFNGDGGRYRVRFKIM